MQITSQPSLELACEVLFWVLKKSWIIKCQRSQNRKTIDTKMTILYDEITHFQLLGYKLNIIYAIMHEFSKKCICVAQFICLSKRKFDQTAFICPHKIILCGFFILEQMYVFKTHKLWHIRRWWTDSGKGAFIGNLPRSPAVADDRPRNILGGK